MPQPDAGLPYPAQPAGIGFDVSAMICKTCVLHVLDSGNTSFVHIFIALLTFLENGDTTSIFVTA